MDNWKINFDFDVNESIVYAQWVPNENYVIFSSSYFQDFFFFFFFPFAINNINFNR